MKSREDVIRIIKAKAKEMGYSLLEISHMCGKSPSYMQKFCGRDATPKQLPMDVIYKLSDIFALPTSAFTGATDSLDTSDNDAFFKTFVTFLARNKISGQNIDVEEVCAVRREIMTLLPQTVIRVAENAPKDLETNVLKGIAAGLLLDERKNRFWTKR